MFKVNDYVIHKKFGIGKILEISGDRAGMKAKIFFIDSEGSIQATNEKEKEYVRVISLNPKLQFLREMNNEEVEKLELSTDFLLLDNINPENDNTHYKNIDEAINGFKKELNTDSFDGEFYVADERNYKIYFHENAKKLLDKELLLKLLDEKNYKQLLENLKNVFSSYFEGSTQNLTHYLEPLKMQDSLDSEEKIETFFRALHNVLYGTENFENRFKNWIDVLESIGHAKWTMSTILLFIIHPDKYMYVKPKTTQNALEVSGFSVHNYSSLPNYHFYSKVLLCSKFIFEKTKEAGLNPKDMIDIQSFMWCIRPEYDNDNRAYED